MKSKNDLITDIANILSNCNGTGAGANDVADYIVSEYASQQAPASTPPVSAREDMTVRKFMFKKFPTNEYMDCPVPKHYWETIQEYAEAYHKSLTTPTSNQ